MYVVALAILLSLTVIAIAVFSVLLVRNHKAMEIEIGRALSREREAAKLSRQDRIRFERSCIGGDEPGTASPDLRCSPLSF